MTLGELLRGLVPVPTELAQLPVTGLSDDTRTLVRGDLFIARVGSKQDGGSYAEEAMALGAIAAIGCGVGATLHCDDMDELLPVLAARFWNLPDERLPILGVTGTNGKTTTTHLLEAACAQWNCRPALVGTIHNRFNGVAKPAKLTTPGLLELHRMMAEARDSGCGAWVMEVSSHALHQGRLGTLPVKVAGFTNLTQDHLDYHKDFEEYYAAKRLLFLRHLAPEGVAVLPLDGEYAQRLLAEVPHRKVTWSTRPEAAADFVLQEWSADGAGQTLGIRTPAGFTTVHTQLFGDFNRENILLALGMAWAAGIPIAVAAKSFAEVQVPGRMQLVWKGEASVIVDYAHTPDALERVLRSVRPAVRGQLRVVFGCGGDRDRSKRPLMGSVAVRFADRTYLTSDNPRTEPPQQILDDVLAGIVDRSSLRVDVDREASIAAAIGELQAGDLLVLAGKGHEDYQIVGDRKFPFDDALVARRYLEARHAS